MKECPYCLGTGKVNEVEYKIPPGYIGCVQDSKLQDGIYRFKYVIWDGNRWLEYPSQEATALIAKLLTEYKENR